MKTYDGTIEYNNDLECYGLMGLDGKWVKEQLKDGDRIAIMIGNDVFHTDFREGAFKPSLQPLPWDNWDLLIGKPAAYHDFETPEPPPVKPINTKRIGLMTIIGGLVLCFVIGGAFALIAKGSFFYGVAAMYAFFGISITFAGVLSMLSPSMLEKGCTTGFGIALHYGTAILSGKVLPAFGCEDPSGRLLIAFVIVALLCYIAWEKHFKSL